MQASSNNTGAIIMWHLCIVLQSRVCLSKRIYILYCSLVSDQPCVQVRNYDHVPSIGTDHNPLPSLLQALNKTVEERCSSISSKLGVLQSMVVGMQASDTASNPGLELLDAGRTLFKQCWIDHPGNVSGFNLIQSLYGSICKSLNAR